MTNREELIEQLQQRFNIQQGKKMPDTAEEFLEGLADFILALVGEEKALVESDLAWCLGKLRGMGSPNEKLERQYGFTAHKDGEK